MKISVSNCSPVIPLYKTSFPLEWNPTLDNCSPKIPILEPLLLKAVQSLNPPYITAAFPIIHSTNCPIVIRLGIA